MTVRNVVDTLIAEGDAWARLGNQVDNSCREFLGRAAGVAEILFSIRDMPYDRPTSVVDPGIILSEWRGTCSSKHILVTHLLGLLGIEATLYMGAYPLWPATGGLPQDLLEMLSRPEEPFWDVHNYVRADFNESLLVDLTWPAELARHAFFRVTRRWDGQSNFHLAAEVREERIMSPDVHGMEAKRVWLHELNPTASARAAREEFIVALSSFIENEIRVACPEESIRATMAALANEEKSVNLALGGWRKETSK